MCISNICTTIGLERRCTQKWKTGGLCRSNAVCASNSCNTIDRKDKDGAPRCVCSLQSSSVLSFENLQGCPLGQSCIERGIQDHFCGIRRPNGERCDTKVPDQCLSGICTFSPNVSYAFCTPRASGDACTDTRQCVGSCTAGVCE